MRRRSKGSKEVTLYEVINFANFDLYPCIMRLDTTGRKRWVLGRDRGRDRTCFLNDRPVFISAGGFKVLCF